MALLDFIKNRNAPQQQPVAQSPQLAAPAPSVESLSPAVKAQAVEAARPVVASAGEGALPKNAPVQPQATPARGRSLGWER